MAAKRAEDWVLVLNLWLTVAMIKNPVVALREIASNKDIAKNLEDSYIQSLQRIQPEIELEMRESDLELGNDWSEQIALLSKELESLGSVEDPDGAASESMFDSNEFDEDSRLQKNAMMHGDKKSTQLISAEELVSLIVQYEKDVDVDLIKSVQNFLDTIIANK